MKKFLSIILALLLIIALASCTTGGDETQSSETESEYMGDETVVETAETIAGKTPKELYTAALAKINAMTNFKLNIIDKTVTSYLGESYVDTYNNEYKTDGNAVYYTTQDYKVWFVGETLYTENSISKEKVSVSATEFNTNLAIKKANLLFPITDYNFVNNNFVKNGDLYAFNFSITEEEYLQYTGIETNDSVDCSAVFNAQGEIVSFSCSSYYTAQSGIVVTMTTTYEFVAFDGVESFGAPADSEQFRTPVKTADIDMSLLDSEATVTESAEKTDYVKITVKDHGDIIVRLYPDVAPKTVENFKNLVANGFYNNLIFHRVIKEFVVQGGDPDGDGTGGSDTTIVGEFASNGFTNNLQHKKGVLSMARLSNNMNSATSQFFIVHGEDAYMSLDSNYASFGYVVRGIEIVDAIANVETNASDKPVTDVVIESITFVTVS